MTSTKRELLSGVAYTAVAKYAGVLISLLISAILARLITPDDFGVVAVATVIITFFNILSDLGIAPAIVQNKELTGKDLSNIFSFTIWVGVFFSICFFFFSWPIAFYYGDSILLPICQILSVNLFFSAANIVPSALLYKNKEFRFLSFRTLILQVVGGVAGVVAALSGAGLYALLIAPVFTSVFVFLVSYWKYPQRLNWGWERESLRKIFVFSTYQFLFSVVNYFSRNLDKLLIGKFLGMSSLGYYEKSYRLMMLPLQNITHVITPVMHPVFSEFQHDLSRLSVSYGKVVRLLAFLGFPLSFFLYFNAREVMLIVFGDQWVSAVPVFQILSLSVGIQLILSTSGSIFQAANDTRMLFVCGLFSSLLTVGGVLTGVFIFNTAEAVAWGVCISFFLNFLLAYFLMFRFTFRLSAFSFCHQFFSPLVLSGICCVVFFLLDCYLPDLGLWGNLLVNGGCFFILFVGYIQFTGEYDLFGKLSGRIHSLF